MKQLNSHNFEQMYKWLGINLNELGCIMLDLEPLKAWGWLAQDGVTDYLHALPTYTSPDKSKFWIKGYVADQTPHITLLYGLLQPGLSYKPHVDKVLEGWKLEYVEIDHFGYFESPYTDEPYYCIVAHIKPTADLVEGNERLEFLPHINTFTGYKPHFTIAYIIKDESWRDDFLEKLNSEFKGKKLKVLGINYGGNK